jgi:hypothetical protein
MKMKMTCVSVKYANDEVNRSVHKYSLSQIITIESATINE